VCSFTFGGLHAILCMLFITLLLKTSETEGKLLSFLYRERRRVAMSGVVVWTGLYGRVQSLTFVPASCLSLILCHPISRWICLVSHGCSLLVAFQPVTESQLFGSTVHSIWIISSLVMFLRMLLTLWTRTLVHTCTRVCWRYPCSHMCVYISLEVKLLAHRLYVAPLSVNSATSFPKCSFFFNGAMWLIILPYWYIQMCLLF